MYGATLIPIVNAGDIIRLKSNVKNVTQPNKLARVIKVNPKRLVCEYEDGSTFSVSHTGVELVPDGTFTKVAPDYRPGMCVRLQVKSAKWKYSADTVFVITRINGAYFTVAKLGGSDDESISRWKFVSSSVAEVVKI